MAYGEELTSTDELYDIDNVDLLARLIYSEAESETEEGKRGVAFVASNRKETSGFPNTYKEVILQKGQFDGIWTKRALKPDTSSQAWKDSLDIASNMATKKNPIGTRTYFQREDSLKTLDKSGTNGTYKGTNSWTSFSDGKIIGAHIFYTANT